MDRSLKSVVTQLKKASKMHLAQAKKIEAHIKAMQKMFKAIILAGALAFDKA